MTSSRPVLLLRPLTWFLLLGTALTLRTLHRPESHTVFPVFAAGSLHWWSGESLYADHAPLDYFRYPPPFAIAFSPFALLGSQAGGVLWAWCSLGVYWLGLRRLLRDVLPGEWTPARESCFLLLALLGALGGLWNGQSNALLTGFLLLGASAFLRGRWWRAGVFLAVPVVCKLTPLPLVLLLCALRPRSLAPRLLACVAVGFLMPFLTRPPAVVVRQHRDWVTHLAESSSKRWVGFRDGWTAWVICRHVAEGGEGLPDLEQPMTGSGYRLIQATAGLLVLTWSLWLRRCGLEERPLLTFTLAGGAGWLLLLGPASEHATFAFLAPWLAWAFVQRRAGPGRGLITLAGVLILVLGWNSLTRPFWPVAPWLLLSLPLGTALFLIGLVRGAADEAVPFLEEGRLERRPRLSVEANAVS